MNPKHLWRGEWIDEAGLERIEDIGDTLARDLDLRLDHDLLLRAADALSRRILAGERQDLYDSLIAAGVPPDNARDSLRAVGGFLARDFLEAKLERELGATRPFSIRRNAYPQPVFEAWAPLGVLVHVAPGNVPTVAPLSVLEGLLAGNINLLKTSTKEGAFPLQLLRALVDEDPTGSLKPFVYGFRFSSKRQDLLGALFRQADGIAAWGGESAMAGVRALAPPDVRVIDWGHRISFAYLTRQAAEDPAVLERVARDTCAIEQQACSSPQCLFLDSDSPEEVLALARRLAQALERISPTYPAAELGTLEAAEITTVTELARLDAVLGKAEVIEAPDRSWRLLVEHTPGLRPSPLFRSLWVKPLPRDRIVATLRPLRAYLQTVGLGCGLDDYAELSALMFRAGATRVTRPGDMLGAYPGEPHDGVYALQRYCRRVCVRLDETIADITNFDDLEPPRPPAIPAGTPILSKEGFIGMEVDPSVSELFFKSGGTSGKPKMSVYTYDDYHAQMGAAAEGLFAAGLDPSRDRCINLFASGHLYGSFLSFYSILEDLQAIQFPMALVEDMEEVGQAIVENRVDTLLGMPTYLITLFHKNADRFRRYRGVKKIFYGGEHFNKAQAELLHRDFGVELIKSAIYGSNDAGPLGFGCSSCSGAVHHVLRTQWLEIVKLDEDKPVEGDEVGRLLFTSLRRRGQRLLRYEIGDVGRWVHEPCPCGRKLPRFELLGRHGDIFRAPYFFNYSQFRTILAEQTPYAGEVQLVLDHLEELHRITVRLDRDGGLDAKRAREALLAHYGALDEFVNSYKMTALEIALVPSDAFERSARTGKLVHIIDRRQQAS